MGVAVGLGGWTGRYWAGDKEHSRALACAHVADLSVVLLTRRAVLAARLVFELQRHGDELGRGRRMRRPGPFAFRGGQRATWSPGTREIIIDGALSVAAREGTWLGSSDMQDTSTSGVGRLTGVDVWEGLLSGAFCRQRRCAWELATLHGGIMARAYLLGRRAPGWV